ncbi:MAG: phytanoyl-CoA dioxygenase family protein [Acidimicrobiales bacterium]
MRTLADHGFLPDGDCHIERRVLRDDALQRQLEDVGWVALPFIDPADVRRLVDGYDELAQRFGGASAPEDYDDTYAEFSIIHSRPDFRRAAYDLICEVLLPPAREHLVDHRPLIANFVNKPPGTGVVPTHQNFSVVDESRFRSVSVWVALVDCTNENGAMSMLDGSHRRLRSRRGMWAYQCFSGIDHDEVASLLTPVEVPAGHAVILDDALVHYSPPNATDHRRLAIQFVMVPEEAPAIWYEQVGETPSGIDATRWEIDEAWFFDFWHGSGDRAHGTDTGRTDLRFAPLDLSTLRRGLGLEVPPAPAAPRQRGLRARISRLSR